MPLANGTRLGVYEVTGSLGAGGMGEVYRARDTRLGRAVALKIIPVEFTHDSDRVARFHREAQVLAALNHPNIAAIYGVEETDGLTALILELVEGPTLADRLAQGPMALDEALPIARQLADALEEAHEHGIIHRDLKPANVKLRGDDTVKVLDFGLAKAIDPLGAAGSFPALADSPTITSPALMTGVGVILGTAAYMAPEQAKGRPADKRSDIWAFGCVLYEMLTGKRAFEGESVAETLSAVLKDTPDWNSLPNLPPSLTLLLRRCLEKDRKKRLGDLAAVQLLLTEPSVAGVGGNAASRLSVRTLLAAGAFLVLAAALVASFWRHPTTGATPPVVRFEIPLPSGTSFDDRNVSAASSRWLDIAPDGHQLVFVVANANGTTRQVLLRNLSDRDATVLPLASGRGNTPVFSPDGQWLALRVTGTDSQIFRVPLSGGAETRVVGGSPGNGFSWFGDRVIYPEMARGIIAAPINGGPQSVLVPLDVNQSALTPQLLPDGDTVLFTLSPEATGNAVDVARWNRAKIVIESIRTHTRTVVANGGSDARYLSPGYIVYGADNNLMAVGFDLQHTRVTGSPVPVVPRVRRSNQTGMTQYAVSNDGTLAYVSGGLYSGQLTLVMLDRQGKASPVNARSGFYEAPRFSPDGTHLAYDTDDGKEARIWISDLKSSTEPRPLTFGGRSRFPVWSGDGQSVVYQSDREGDLAIYSQRADGSEPAVRLTRPEPGTVHIPESWLAQSDAFSFSALSENRASLWLFRMRDQKASEFRNVRSILPMNSSISPDGRWIAYSVRSAGTTTVYVEPLPATGARYEVPVAGAHHPAWSADGSQLFVFPSGGMLVSLGVRTKPSFEFSVPSVVAGAFRANTSITSARNHDVSPDGQGFVAVDSGDLLNTREESASISVVLNWFEELKAKLPSR